MKMRSMAAAMVVAAGTAAMGQTYLMVPDSLRDVVMLFDPTDGTLVNPAWINLVGLAPSQTPIAAIEVDDEIWISDQLADMIYRFTKDEFAPQHLGNISGGMDNIRGIVRVGDTVYVTNAGLNNGAPGNGVVMIDVATRAVIGSFPSGSPFDILPFGANLLVNDIGSAARKIDEFTTGGSHVRVFATGPNFPEQMTYNAAGNILVATFSSPIGIFEFDTNGSQVNFYAVGTGNRGVHELGNGDILLTYGTTPGIYTYNIASNTSTPVAGVPSGSPRFIHPVTFGEACYPDCDTSTGVGVLDIFDFLCFGNRFSANDPYACDCDTQTGVGVCDIFDFLCFGNAFNAGCP